MGYPCKDHIKWNQNEFYFKFNLLQNEVIGGNQITNFYTIFVTTRISKQINLKFYIDHSLPMKGK